ncbi:MAG TPA: hypothetical protein DCS43_08440 [Verrucomicrobia bacterium]|nr:hypothetical protein [Verrucomicrobiota bacterium]
MRGIRWIIGEDGALKLWVMAIIVAIFWGGEYWRRQLWEPDEARYAYVSTEMQQDGHWLVPHRNREYYAHKPPLMFWLINAASVLNGGEINQVTTRIPTWLGTSLSLWATGRIAAMLFGGTAGLMAPALLAVSALFWRLSGAGHIDGLLCGLQMLAFWLLLSASRETASRPGLRRVGAYLAMGLAVLSKGPVGLLVPLGAWVAFCLFSGCRSRRQQWHCIWGIPLALLPTALWLGSIVYFNAAPDGYFDELLFKQNIGRASGSFAVGHKRPFWYFFVYFFGDFMPWTPLFPAALIALRRDNDVRRMARGVAAWGLFVLFFFTLSTTKRNLYTLMAYPAAAILLAAGWDRIRNAPVRMRIVSQRLLAGILILAGVVMASAEGVMALLQKAAPVSLMALIPGGCVLLLAGIVLLRTTHDQNLTRWLATAAGGIAYTLAITAFLLYPVLNTVKTPHALVAAAKTRLPAHQDLLLYRIHGEIQALYCRTRGRQYHNPTALVEAMRAQQTGMVVLESSRFHEIAEVPEVKASECGHFNMGQKEMLWIAFKR